MTLHATPYSVRITVTDSIGEPEAYSTVRIYSPSDSVKPKVIGVTDADGRFSKSLPSAGKYVLHLHSVGKDMITRSFSVSNENPVADLGNITTQNTGNMLQEVTVTAARPLVTKEIDRIGYDVQADDESKTSTLEETLRKVPLVSVDADGTIKVKGSTDFKIYKNGRPNNSFTKNAKEIFKAIPASMIKKIEVITDPGAREDAEGVGAILNIVTLENTVMNGVMGTASLNYDVRSDVPSPNLWLTSQINKVTLSAYAGASRMSKRQTKSHVVSEGVYDESGNIRHSDGIGKNPGWITWFGIDGSYELDSLNLFTAEFGGYYYDINVFNTTTNSLTASDGSLIYSYDAIVNQNPYRYFDLNGNFNYQHSTKRKGETLTLSYMISTTNQRQNSKTEYENEVNMPVQYTGILSDFRLDFTEHTFQFDWTRPIADIHTLSIGTKYIYRDNHSRTKQNYIGFDDQPLIDFTHSTHVAAGYADYRVRLGRVSLRGGLRYEFSRLSAEYADNTNPAFASNLSDWVPNAAISYNINDANTIKASFGTRINRPGISFLNPAINETPDNTSQGNPDLGSARNSSLSLNYSLISQKVNIDFSAGYNFSNNDIIAVQHIEGNHFYQTFANAGRNKSFTTGLFVQWMAGKKTSVMFNGNASYNHYANPSLKITNGGWGGNAYCRISQKLPWKLNATVGMSLWAGNINGLYGINRPYKLSMLDYSISLQRSFLKEDRLTVRLSTWNPAYTSTGKIKSKNINVPYRSTTYSINEHPSTFAIALSYRFGSINAQVKKTAKSIQNDDLSGRKL